MSERDVRSEAQAEVTGPHLHAVAGGAGSPAGAGSTGAPVVDGEASRREARVRLATARGLARAAHGAHDLAGRAGETGGAVGRTEPLARGAGQRLAAMSAYLQSHRTDEILGDLERTVRKHPLRAMAIAFVAGYLTRRIF